MSDAKIPETVLKAIVMTLENSPKKQATLKQLYNAVPILLCKDVRRDTIRGIINRSLVTRNKSGPYPVLFVRVAEKTYSLAETRNR